MNKRIIAGAIAFLLTACFTACNRITPEEGKTAFSSATQATTTEEFATTTTTAAVTTTTTTRPTTTKKPTTTAKPTTTKAPETTTEVSETGDYLSVWEETKRESETEQLKYGVTVRRIIKIYYDVLVDGTKVESKREVSESYNRSNYSASYADLLPAAKKNRNTYSDFIDEILRITNEYRAEGGLEPLTLSTKITEIANVRAEEIAWSGNHTHNRPDGSRCFSLFREQGFEEGLAGENIGWGFTSPEAVCLAWKKSKTHYENIMNPRFTKIGIGVAADADPSDNLCWVQHFYE